MNAVDFSPSAHLKAIEVEMQSGVECVLYATLNAIKTAVRGGFRITPAQPRRLLEDMGSQIPRRTEYSYRRMGAEWINWLRSKDLIVQNDFIWREALLALKDGKGAFVARIDVDHAVAIVGLRANESTERLEFLVANSLPQYPVADRVGRLNWIPGLEFLERIAVSPAGTGARSTQDLYLLRWD